VPSFPSFLVSEPPAIDLVNTRMYLSGNWVDLLDSPGSRIEWLSLETARLGFPPDEVVDVDEDVAAALKTVRQHIGEAIEPARHGKRPPARALAGLNTALRAAPAIPEVRWNGTAVDTLQRRSGTLSDRLACSFAEAAIELLAAPSILRVRRCDAPACVALFLPRNPNRRWCTPSICGNRARVARYYLRHKEDETNATI
jgi:predicted RNA-binding Zn ribbon-like protein